MKTSTFRFPLVKIAAVVALLCGATVLAADNAADYKPNRQPLRQLGRGVSNVATGILEVPTNWKLVTKDQGEVAGATYGTVRGVWRFLVREVVGVFEIVTFPVGWSAIIEPEFPCEPVQTTEWKVNPLRFYGD